MRRLMVLAVVVAMVLVAAVPALAQSGGDAQVDQYSEGGEIPLLACEEFATQEEAQQFLDENPDDPYNIDPDGNGIACEFGEKPEPGYEEATLNFELAVEGQCAADTTFFAGMSTSHGYSVPLADSDGDGVYIGSIEFGKGVELAEILMYKGTGLQEGPYGQIPVGEPETIQSFGPLTVTGDKTFSATANCEEPPAPVDPEKTEKGNPQENDRTGLKMLPDTGGASLMFLGVGVLLIGGGLVARKILG